MRSPGLAEIKETEPLTSFSPKTQIHVLFQLHLHNFQQGFPNKQCLSCLPPCPLHAPLPPAACSSIKACPVLQSVTDTGTGQQSGGQEVMGRVRGTSQDEYCFWGSVCTVQRGNRKMQRKLNGGRQRKEAVKTKKRRHEHVFSVSLHF